MVMLADTKLRSQVDNLWDKLWTGGLSNPLDAIEQLSFLFFLKQLDEREQDAERAAKKRGQKFDAAIYGRRAALVILEPAAWRQGPQHRQRKSLSVSEEARCENGLVRRAHGERRVQDQQAEPAHRGLQSHRRDADLRAEPGRAGRPLRVPSQQLNTAGTNGQFRTPRHIIRMMVQMIDPQAGRAHLRSGRRHVRLPRQRLATPPRNAHRSARSQLSTRKAGRTA